jgi:hypothetical protein
MSPRQVTRRPEVEPQKSVRLRTAIVTMAVTFVLTVLLLMAYLTSGCHLPDPGTRYGVTQSQPYRVLARYELRDIFGYARTVHAERAARSSTPVIGKARGRGQHPGIPSEWTPILDVHPSAFRPDPLPAYVWLQLPDRIREVHRQCLEFWYDPPGCALTDEELELLRRIAAAGAPVMFRRKAGPFQRTALSTTGWTC